MTTTIQLSLALTLPGFGLVAGLCGEWLIGAAMVLNGIYAIASLTNDAGNCQPR